TYRHMAEDCVDQAATIAKLEARPCVTKDLPIHGACADSEELGALWFYGADAAEVAALGERDPSLAEPLDPRLPITRAQLVWAIREEMARTVDDLLSRRTRALLFDAQACIDLAPEVAELL